MNDINKEYERKFLIDKKNIPTLVEKHSVEITQAYLIVAPDGTIVRLRKTDDFYELGLKSGKGIVRDEPKPMQISAEHFETLLHYRLGDIIKKTRYILSEDEPLLCLNIYKGKHAGFITAEVEFHSEEEGRAFEPFAWFGKEITDDSFYTDASIAIFGLPTNFLGG